MKCKKCKDSINLFIYFNNGGLCGYCFKARLIIINKKEEEQRILNNVNHKRKIKSRLKYFEDVKEE